MPFITLARERIEYERIDSDRSESPTFVMLHEGLGSVSLWKDFPGQLARATQSNVVVYSRHGHGRSASLRAPRTPTYMHDEALIILPAFLDALSIENPILFGHSDGASIALIHAGGSGRAVSGVVALAPHVMVEDISIASIAAAKVAFETGTLRARLARYHDDVDGIFRAWNTIWLDPRFRSWNIEEYVARITCPVLAIQGEDDEYGTMEQLERLARATSDVTQLRLPHCRHSPHREQVAVVLQATAEWTRRICGGP